METVLFGAFLTRYDAIKAPFKGMKAFLNVNEETELFYYRSICILKIVFLVYAFDRAVHKYLFLILKHAGNLCNASKGSRKTIRNILSAVVIFLFYKESFPSGEFFMDIFMLIVSLNYAVETYKKELQKVSSIIFMCLFVLWYINHKSNTEQFRMCAYFKVSMLLFLSYLPMMPNNPKYRFRLAYLYVLMYILIFYKIGQHYDRHRFVMHQTEIKEATGEERLTKHEPERDLLDDTLQNFDESYKSICSDTENIQSSCYTPQKIEPDRTVFSSNKDQNTAGKLERVSKAKSFIKSIQNEDTINTIKNDISDVKKVKKYKNFGHRSGTLKVHDNPPSGSRKRGAIENKQKIEDTVFELPKTVRTDDETIESNDEQSKIKVDEIYKNTENKDMTAQAEETRSEEAPRSELESTNKASAKENDATGSSSKAASGNKVTEMGEVADNGIEITEAAYRESETTKSNDDNLKPEGKKILNGKNKIRIIKRRGEIGKADAASEVKANEFGSKVERNDSAIQNITPSKNSIRAKIRSSIQGTARENLANDLRLGKVSPIKIGHNSGTRLQIKNDRASKDRSLIISSNPEKKGKIKPSKIKTIKSAKRSLPSKISLL